MIPNHLSVYLSIVLSIYYLSIYLSFYHSIDLSINFLYADRRGITFSIDPAWSNSARTLKITPQETFCLFSLYIVIFSTISYFFLFFYQGADGAFERVPDGAASKLYWPFQGFLLRDLCRRAAAELVTRCKQARNTTNHRDHHLKNTR